MNKYIFTPVAVAMLAVASFAQNLEGAEVSLGSSSSETAQTEEYVLVQKNCIEYKHGAGEYTKHCYNKGLNSMEDGACYIFNPAKAAEFEDVLYVNNTASDTAWWVKTDCQESVPVSMISSSSEESVVSESSDSRRTGEFVNIDKGCIEYMHGAGEYTKHCYNNGLNSMEDGACYIFNPEKIAQHGNDLYVNGTASDPAWWVKTNCFDKKELVERCLDYSEYKGVYSTNCFKAGEVSHMEKGKCYAMRLFNEKEKVARSTRSFDWYETSCYDTVYVDGPTPYSAEDVKALARPVVTEDSKDAAFHVASFNAVKTLRVFDMNGKLLHSESFTGSFVAVDLAKVVGKGAFMVSVSEGDKVIAKKRMTIR